MDAANAAEEIMVFAIWLKFIEIYPFKMVCLIALPKWRMQELVAVELDFLHFTDRCLVPEIMSTSHNQFLRKSRWVLGFRDSSLLPVVAVKTHDQ